MNAVRKLVMRYIAPFVLTYGVQAGFVIAAGLLMTACSGSDVSRAFGLHRPTPDEYTVTTRTPLSMPPSEVLVHPGSTKVSRPDESPRMQALETLAPDIALHPVEGTMSDGQATLISQVKDASQAPQNSELGDSGAGFVDSLMFWQGGRAGSVVDGAAENQRIQKNLALGQKLDNGATPTMRGK